MKIPGILYLVLVSVIVVMIGTAVLAFIQPFIPFGALGLLVVGIVLALIFGVSVHRGRCR